MAFKLANFGSDSANAKGTFGGINYYRYDNADGDTITTAGYFPGSLGLKVGDRIRVIPATRTVADSEYVVTAVSGTTVTVALGTSNVSGIPAAPSATGTYKLRCVVASTGATYSWVADA